MRKLPALSLALLLCLGLTACIPAAEDAPTPDGVIPIVDGRMVLAEEWLYRLPVYAINDEIQHLADKRARGEELSETERLAPTSPLEDGMTVEEIITFLNTWRNYCNRASADFSARKAAVYG